MLTGEAQQAYISLDPEAADVFLLRSFKSFKKC